MANRGTGFSALLLGARAGLTGLAMLVGRPRRLVISLVPAIAGLFGSIALFTFAMRHARGAYQQLADACSRGGHGKPLTFLLLALGAVLIVGLIAALFFGVIAAVSAPVGNLLSGQAEAERAGKEPPALTMAQELVEAGRSIGHALLRLTAYFVGVALLGAVSLLLPPATLVTAPLSLVWTGAYMAYDLLDPTLSRRRMGFAEKWQFLRTHRDACTGLVLVTTGVLLIPFANLLLWPGLAMGGAVLFVDLTRED